MAKNIGREAMILKKRRKELGLTQTEVADAIGIQLQQYQMFEYGTRKVSTSSMILGLRLCAALELKPYELVFEKESDWVKKVSKV
ncbi:MAG TPA: helix-turn-helix transcriptional regulator [Ruminococcus sp.]|jgi:DNA-binding XRE family transcriptional regulator|nr:helix-turn-helix transcriptional regulator [Ruminococcus flavefaciens]HRU98943.1 helix-turn-helix transcriptional regulator [Ruminococcus sp.]